MKDGSSSLCRKRVVEGGCIRLWAHHADVEDVCEAGFPSRPRGHHAGVYDCGGDLLGLRESESVSLDRGLRFLGGNGDLYRAGGADY